MYIKRLRRLGCSIGDDVNFFGLPDVNIDVTRPWLITIGNHVNITRGVTILTHGYDWAVFKTLYGEVLGSSGEVSIGNNVFIGMNATILKGVHVGNNVIIGAGSLVNKDIPDNCVAAGNPCRVIMSLEDYYQKRKDAQIAEATELVKRYRERYNEEPDNNALREFYWIFTNDSKALPEEWKKVQKLCANQEFSDKKLEDNQRKFKDKNEFLKSIK